MQWLKYPNESNVVNLNNVRHEASWHFRNKKKECVKAKIIELETNSKIKNIRDFSMSIIAFKKGYQLRARIGKGKKGYLVLDSYSILARWRNHFSQLLNGHGVNNVRQTEIPTAEPLLPKPIAFEVEMAIEKLKRHKSPGTVQIPAAVIKARGRTFDLGSMKLLIPFGKRRS
jgi:hypothetical protein